MLWVWKFLVAWSFTPCTSRFERGADTSHFHASRSGSCALTIVPSRDGRDMPLCFSPVHPRCSYIIRGRLRTPDGRLSCYGIQGHHEFGAASLQLSQHVRNGRFAEPQNLFVCPVSIYLVWARVNEGFSIPHVEQVAEGHAYLDGIARRLWLSSLRYRAVRCGCCWGHGRSHSLDCKYPPRVLIGVALASLTFSSSQGSPQMWSLM